MKLKYEDKLEIIKLRDEGKTWSALSKKYKINESNLRYLYKLYQVHGIETLEHKYTSFTKDVKVKIINEALDGASMESISIKYKLSNSGTLIRWLKEFKENCYNVVIKPKGRPITMKNNKANEVSKVNNSETAEEEITRLKKKLEYQNAEIEYLKKLRALVQEKNQQSKKK